MMPTLHSDPIVPVPPDTTLNYDQSFSLMQDTEFRGRVQVACLAYAQEISLEASSTPAHNTRLRWAQGVYANPGMVANQVTPPVVMDPGVQEAGSDTTDQALQAAVQAVVNDLM